MSQGVKCFLLGFLLLSSGCWRAITPYPSSPKVPFEETILPSPMATNRPSPSPTPQFYEEKVIGYSVEGRPLVAHRFGWGEVKLVLLGDIHGGTEENTCHLLEQMIA